MNMAFYGYVATILTEVKLRSILLPKISKVYNCFILIITTVTGYFAILL